MTSTGSFVRTPDYEKDSRVKRLVNSGLEVKVWLGAHKFTFFPDELINEKDQLGFTFDEPVDSIVGEQVYISFDVPPGSYFSRGKIIKDEGYSFVFDDDLFRYEKRKSERIRLFPTYRCFLTLEADIYNSDDNVIPIQKNEWIDTKVLNEFAKYSADHGEPKIGYRLADFSSDGLSFVVSKKEVEFFCEGKLLAGLKIEVKEKLFDIQSAEVKYVIDYIDTKATQVPMHKIGLLIKTPNPELEEEIRQLTGYVPFDEEKEIEEFLEK